LVAVTNAKILEIIVLSVTLNFTECPFNVVIKPHPIPAYRQAGSYLGYPSAAGEGKG